MPQGESIIKQEEILLRVELQAKTECIYNCEQSLLTQFRRFKDFLLVAKPQIGATTTLAVRTAYLVLNRCWSGLVQESA